MRPDRLSEATRAALAKAIGAANVPGIEAAAVGWSAILRGEVSLTRMPSGEDLDAAAGAALALATLLRQFGPGPATELFGDSLPSLATEPPDNPEPHRLEAFIRTLEQVSGMAGRCAVRARSEDRPKGAGIATADARTVWRWLWGLLRQAGVKTGIANGSQMVRLLRLIQRDMGVTTDPREVLRWWHDNAPPGDEPQAAQPAAPASQGSGDAFSDMASTLTGEPVKGGHTE